MMAMAMDENMRRSFILLFVHVIVIISFATATTLESKRAASVPEVEAELAPSRANRDAAASHREWKLDNVFDEEDDDPLCPLFHNVDDSENSAGNENEDATTLNIHVVPHTHDDVGWLKTVDQYLYGLNNTIQQADVSLILDNVIQQLLDTSATRHKRTFTYVETSFFSRWYARQSPATQQSVRTLISNRQLAFANGGWCMHDEATTHYMGMIDQTTLGHRFLKSELGVVPKVGWQIDPFGHSLTQANLLTHKLGMDALYFGRIHYADLESRLRTADIEGIWNPVPQSYVPTNHHNRSNLESANGDKSVFWGLTGSYRGNYGAPDNFCFDALCSDDPLVGLTEQALVARMDEFLNKVAIQVNQTKGRNVMLTMGSDFQYSQARKNFQNLDLLMDATLQYLSDGTLTATKYFGTRFDKVEIFYSDPERYTRCKYADLINSKYESNSRLRHARQAQEPKEGLEQKPQEEQKRDRQKHPNDRDIEPNIKSSANDPKELRGVRLKHELPWKTKTGDFFPYADCDHCYWTGYFSSRQSLKRMERVGSSFLHASRQIDSMARLYAPTMHSDNTNQRDGKTTPDNDILLSTRNSIERNNSPKMLASRRTSHSFPTLPVKTPSVLDSPLFKLDDAMGIAQHHDAVSGTSKQHVAYDYAKRISEGMEDTNAYVTGVLREALLDNSNEFAGMLGDLTYCNRWLNETVCDVSKVASQSNDRYIYIVVYNALPTTRSEVIPIPVDIEASYSVQKLMNSSPNVWEDVNSSLLSNLNYAQINGAAKFVLYMDALEVPPLGASIFRITKSREANEMPSVTRRTLGTQEGQRDVDIGSNRLRKNALRARDASRIEDIVKSNGVLTVTFDGSTGTIKSISEEREGGITVDIVQDYGYYTSFTNGQSSAPRAQFMGNTLKGDGMCLPGYFDAEGNEMPWLLGTASEWQNSGAYIFRPSESDQSMTVLPPQSTPESLLVYETDLVTEVHAKFGDPSWITQITRLVSGKNYVEVEYVVGPVPNEDQVGKEVVSRYATQILNGPKFFTDSNGREFISRTNGVLDVSGFDGTITEGVAGNYYPVNAAIYIEDEKASFGILTDRSQGGSSISNGSIELMIQRRILRDDARGVGEPLDETDMGIEPYPPYGDASRLGGGIIVKSTHRLVVGPGNHGARGARSQMDSVFSQPHVFVASSNEKEIAFRRSSVSLLKSPLPENVMIITFAALEKNKAFLVRLGHQYDTDEDASLSLPVRIDLRDLFPDREILTVTEKTLSGNQNLADWENRRLRWNDVEQSTHANEAEIIDSRDVMITLNPMDVRTFEIIVS